MLTPIVRTIEEVQAAVARARGLGMNVGFVPTMGALHEGHAALIRAAGLPSAFVVVSIFVNPTQFGPNEDYSKYPRTLDADRSVCAAAGANLIFAPAAEEMYPTNATAFADVSGLGDALCGASRPGHFRGVCTVVLKLFNIVAPDVAYFGAKDYQQARIIQRMVIDLNLPMIVNVEPTVRNRYLSSEQRAAAPAIYRALQATQDRVSTGERSVSILEANLQTELAAIPGARIDYASIVDAETLQPLVRIERHAVAAIAVYLGTTRLIDNIVLGK